MNIRFKTNILSTRPASQRVHVTVDGFTVVSSDDALILNEAGHSPVYYFPLTDVADGVLVPSPRASFCALKGTATYYSISVPGGRIIENAVWRYPNPKDGVREIADRVAFYPHLVRIAAE